MKCAVLTAGRLIETGLQVGGFRYRAAMVTLTYRNVYGWQPEHISDFLKCVREYLRRRNVRMLGVWVAELQERGAVHYHLVLWLPKGLTLPKPDKRGWWPHGSTRIEWARRPVGYLVKYASKADPFRQFPKGCRIHAALGLDKLQRMERRWWRMPRYVRERWP